MINLHNTIEYIRLSTMSATTTIVPWMVPVTYAAILWLQINGASPHFLLILVVTWAVIWTMLLWYGYAWLGPKIKKYVKVNKERDNSEHIQEKYDEKKVWWLKKQAHHLHQKMHFIDNPWVLYGIVIINCTLPIPDLVVIMHAQQKIKTLWFLISTIIGKLLNYIPIIYGIELGKMLF